MRVKLTLIALVLSFGLAAMCGCSSGEKAADSDDAQNPPIRQGVNNPRAIAKSDLEAILSLGYVSSAPVIKGTQNLPTVLHDSSRAYPGLNLYNSRRNNSAVLMDNDGKVVWSWEYKGSESWHHIKLLPNGDLLAIDKNRHIIRLGKNSNLLWEYNSYAHHDIDVDADGNIYFLNRKYVNLPKYSENDPTVEDFITVLSPEGKHVKDISVLKILEKSGYAFLLPVVNQMKLNRQVDILHTNALDVFDGSLSRMSSMYKKGNMLLSMRNINFICIVDPDKGSVVWGWGPTNVVLQHQPSLLDNGNILIFDNGTNYSRVIELDPSKNRIVWQYGAEKSEAFHSVLGSGAQRLPNGNTLITNYDAGAAIEVTPDNKIVWKFMNPDVFENADGKLERGKIYRVTRINRDTLLFLN